MTMHPSLRSGGAKKGHRSVLKRYERLSILEEKERWDETKSVFGLAKVKTLKVKIKKEKAAEAETAAAATGTTAEASTVSAAGSVKSAGAVRPASGAPATKPQPKKEEKKK